jgi:beta-lactam-binding protein with PASTA domain
VFHVRVKGEALNLVVGIGGALVGAVIPALLPRGLGYRQEWTEVARVTVKWYLAAPTLKGTITAVSPADGTQIKAGSTIDFSCTIRNDSSVNVYAYPYVIVTGLKTGTEYKRFTIAVETIAPGASKTFSAPGVMTMPNEDVQVTVIAYMKAA